MHWGEIGALGKYALSPLQAFDAIMGKFENSEIPPQKADQNTNNLLYYILIFADIDVPSLESEADVFSATVEILRRHHDLDHNQKCVLAACFFRVLAQRMVSDSLERKLPGKGGLARIIEILESAIQTEDLYNGQKRLQTFQKVDALAKLYREHEQAIESAIHELTSLDRFEVHRQNMLRVISSPLFQSIFGIYYPDGIKARLAETYKKIEVYQAQGDSFYIVDAYANVQESLQELVNDLQLIGTTKSFQLDDAICNKLSRLVAEDFATHTAAQPADVSVVENDKKYPLHLTNREIEISLTLKNNGPGYADAIEVFLVTDDCLLLPHEQIRIGRLAPGSVHVEGIKVTILEYSAVVSAVVKLTWRNFDNSQSEQEVELRFFAQNSQIDWERLRTCDAYSLEPVDSEKELIGRQEVLSRLIALAEARSVGSALIHGQKRVGKTSIARALASYLRQRNYVIVYLEGGDYTDPDPRVVISRLGKRICRKIKELVFEAESLDLPEFHESLAPLTEFLDALEAASNRRIMIILDEFDELPITLYLSSPIADAFFLTLRSIASRPQIGFVLVGGEKMTHILQQQGDQLNKWQLMPVDYFSRGGDWTDYIQLVQKPVHGILEYTKDAMLLLHNATAGNPYFTNLVCQAVVQLALARHDSHITDVEVLEALRITVDQVDSNTFQHFWTDGILESGEIQVEKTIARRKILIAVRDALSKKLPTPISRILEHPLVQNILSPEAELNELVSRKVLISSSPQLYEFKVPLFHDWLKNHGIQDLIATFSDLDYALKRRQEEERIRVRSDELVALVDKWGIYRGRRLTEDRIRDWLEQFGSVQEQRAMMTLLQSIQFYGDGYIREKMKDIDSIVRAGLLRHVDSYETAQRREEKQRRRRADILVSYLDGPGKSGASFANIYINEASIYAKNAVERGRLAKILGKKLQDDEDVQALVFIDDFVGTGNSASRYLKNLDSQLWPTLRESDVRKVVFVAVVAFEDGWQYVQQTADRLRMADLLELNCCELLTNDSQCFSDSSAAFRDPEEREFAKKIALSKGILLFPEAPLGYGDLGMSVVFEHGCPNNTLPILWAESDTESLHWKPLFKRH